jgi:dipeptidyl aminopeptidase/acylaminoacyl peptidase
MRRYIDFVIFAFSIELQSTTKGNKRLPRNYRLVSLLAGMALSSFCLVAQTASNPITLDEFMNATDVKEVKLSPDGSEAVIATIDSDWQHHRFRTDLWIWKAQTGQTVPLTRSGHARSPQWSPDGKYIAFLSDLPLPNGDDKDTDNVAERVWLIAAGSGEAFPLYDQKLEAHAFAWSADASQLFFSCASPLPKSAEEAEKAQWKDVIRWREQERGDLLLAMPMPAAQKNSAIHPPAENDSPLPPLSRTISSSHDEIKEIAPDHRGAQIAWITDSVSHRLENPSHNEIYLVSTAGGEARRLTNNLAIENSPQWSPDSSKLYFHVGAAAGSVEPPYRDVQGRLYVLDPATGAVKRLGADFPGSFEDFTVTAEGKLIAAGLKGTEQQLYAVDADHATLLPGLPGNYSGADAAPHARTMLVKHSTLTDPVQVYLAADPSRPGQAKAISSFNVLFTQRAQPEWKSYRWKADDGTMVEGILIYPPHHMGEKNLRMLTLIHGGPAEANGNYFGADWYEWANLAAANGWLVFRPNYRGSSGYGDDFMLQITPHLVSRPGKDILEGVDALVKDGIADPAHLTIGGYSYGGYMTNWLITQTTEFKAAVTGAGAVEHAANWGNDDLTYDDANYLGGVLPWQNPGIYQSEAALYQIDKVKTPTHIVAGNADVRVSYLEDLLLERALQQLQVPHSLLVFPQEGHSLEKDPWHGYIKVREELLWLEKYGGAVRQADVK